jgi:hypothetical protein
MALQPVRPDPEELVKVPRLSELVKTLARKLDRGLVIYFSQLGWLWRDVLCGVRCPGQGLATRPADVITASTDKLLYESVAR